MSRILVIDDDLEISALLKRALSGNSHYVQTASNGREGLRLLGESPYDIVITDIIMPEVDGFEVIMAIKKMPLHPRIIAISGGSAGIPKDDLLMVAKAMGVHRILQKPFLIDELIAAVGIPGACEDHGEHNALKMKSMMLACK
jgi:CheY-like chemotaxis protein